jgi:hypothetical protein
LKNNEVMRFDIVGNLSATEVVLLRELGGDEVKIMFACFCPFPNGANAIQ